MSLNLREYLSMLVKEHGMEALLEEMISMQGLACVIDHLRKSLESQPMIQGTVLNPNLTDESIRVNLELIQQMLSFLNQHDT